MNGRTVSDVAASMEAIGMSDGAPVSLNGWSAEVEAALTTAYRGVIDDLVKTTGLAFKVTHAGGNVWNLTATLGRGDEVCLIDGDSLRLDFDGEADGCWAAGYVTDGEEPREALVMTDLTSDGALFAVAVALLWTTPDPR